MNNFQAIREELVHKKETQEESEELYKMKKDLKMEVHKHDGRMNRARYVFIHVLV